MYISSTYSFFFSFCFGWSATLFSLILLSSWYSQKYFDCCGPAWRCGWNIVLQHKRDDHDKAPFQNCLATFRLLPAPPCIPFLSCPSIAFSLSCYSVFFSTKQQQHHAPRNNTQKENPNETKPFLYEWDAGNWLPELDGADGLRNRGSHHGGRTRPRVRGPYTRGPACCRRLPPSQGLEKFNLPANFISRLVPNVRWRAWGFTDQADGGSCVPLKKRLTMESRSNCLLENCSVHFTPFEKMSAIEDTKMPLSL